MTALWFACQHAPSARDTAGALFAIDVTDLPQIQSIDYKAGSATYGSIQDGASWTLKAALQDSLTSVRPFVVIPTLPDDRMRAQEGLFIAGAMANTETLSDVDDLPIGMNAIAPGVLKLKNLFMPGDKNPGRPADLPFCVLIIPSHIKTQMRSHLAGTYNRNYRTLFPDVAGLRDALAVGAVSLRDEPSSPPDAAEAASN